MPKKVEAVRPQHTIRVVVFWRLRPSYLGGRTLWDGVVRNSGLTDTMVEDAQPEVWGSSGPQTFVAAVLSVMVLPNFIK